MHVTSMIGSLDGNKKIYNEESGPIEKFEEIGIKVAIGLDKKGANKLL